MAGAEIKFPVGIRFIATNMAIHININTIVHIRAGLTLICFYLTPFIF